MKPGTTRHLAAVVTVTAMAVVVAVAVGLFRGSFTNTVAVTVISARAGLMMNPDAKVKLNGVVVGRVAAVEVLPDGRAALELAMDPSQLDLIPDNVGVDIASSTVFGAKNVELVVPEVPSVRTLRAGQVLDGGHVTVEVNTIFQQLTTVLAKVEPAKLNETLGALAKALDGRGAGIGQTLSDLNAYLAAIDPSLPNLEHDLQTAPVALDAYADAAPDLLATLEHTVTLGDTVVGERQHLDALLISLIGLGDIGTDVIGSNRAAVTDVNRLLVPTTDLTEAYHPALTCAAGGFATMATAPPLPVPGLVLSQSFFLGVERYRYPQNLPKVAATGGPQCLSLPDVGFQNPPPYVVTDIDANPAQYGNQGILLNADGLKQALFGPIDGPPRNTAQIGQPG